MESKKRNEELYYTARDLAVIFNNLALDCQSEAEILGNIWAKERAYLREFFKTLRIRLLYGPGGAYVRLKRRTLLSQLNAQRLRPQVAQRIQTCLRFYRIGMFSRGEIPCRLEETKPDDLIVLRIVAKKPSVQKARPGK